MSAFYDLSKTPRNILNQAIVRAIVSENNGAWFDPSDMSTLYQDAAGTIPVTAVEQPVGKILDKSGNGNHATQSVTASRPVLSARYNLLTKTEDFSDAVWLKQAAGVGAVPVVTPNYGIAPNGEQTADRLIFNLKGGLTSGDYSRLAQPVTSVANTSHESSFYARTLDGSTVTMKFSINGYPTQTITITPAWSRISIFGSRVDTTYSFILDLRGTFGTSNYADILLWGANTRIGTSAGPYQRVNTATNYDTDPRYFPKYLRFDGVDDYLNLPYMGLYAGGGMSIIAARDAVSQSTDTYIISERSITDANPKYFPSRQLASAGNMDAYIADDAGAVVLDTTGSAFGGASNAVVRSAVDAGNNIKLFKNGALAASDNYTRAGTLTLNTTAIGASVSTTTSNYASMKLYGLIITKSALTDAQRKACERHLSRKAGVAL